MNVHTFPAWAVRLWVPASLWRRVSEHAAMHAITDLAGGFTAYSADGGWVEPAGQEGQRPNLVEEKVLVTEFLLEQPDMDEARAHVQALAHCLLLAGEQAALFTVTRPDGYVQGHIMKA